MQRCCKRQIWQNMSAGHLFAVSKINTLSRQGQGNLPLLFLCENFLRYNIGAFFVGKLPRCPRRQSKRKSVKVFYPCNFVVSSYSKALRIPLRQNMSAGHLFAVSKINTLSRQGQGNLPFPLIRICKRRANTCFFSGKRLSLK